MRSPRCAADRTAPGSLAQHLARGLGAQAHHHTEHQGLGLVLRKLPQEGQGLTSAEHVLDPQVVVDWIRRIHHSEVGDHPRPPSTLPQEIQGAMPPDRRHPGAETVGAALEAT